MDDLSPAPVLRLPPGQKVASRVRTRPSQLMLGVVQPDGVSVLWITAVDTHGLASLYRLEEVRPGRAVPVRGDEVPCPARYEYLLG